MLVARGKMEVGAVSFSLTLALERRFRVYVEERQGSIWDTRFVRQLTRARGKRPAVYVLLEGWHEWHGRSAGAMPAPVVFVASHDVLDGMRGDEFARSAGGAPFLSVQLRLLDAPDLREEGPRRVEDADAIIAAARRVASTANDDLRAPIAGLLEACADAGIAPRGLADSITRQESANFTRIWTALRARHILVARFPALEHVADSAGVSARHAARAFDELIAAFKLEWSGWRDVLNDVRLRWAVSLLSSPSVSIAEVAASAGYGSVTALATALRKAGLPGPREVRSLILRREEERIARSRPEA